MLFSSLVVTRFTAQVILLTMLKLLMRFTGLIPSEPAVVCQCICLFRTLDHALNRLSPIPRQRNHFSWCKQLLCSPISCKPSRAAPSISGIHIVQVRIAYGGIAVPCVHGVDDFSQFC
jgi:hypothetical protein